LARQGESGGVDAVIWIPADFTDRVERGDMEAMELDSMLVTRRPEALYAAEDGRDWDFWVELFCVRHAKLMGNARALWRLDYGREHSPASLFFLIGS